MIFLSSVIKTQTPDNALKIDLDFESIFFTYHKEANITFENSVSLLFLEMFDFEDFDLQFI